jgi:ribosomal protein S18 acetylase RimI-like enzyme
VNGLKPVGEQIHHAAGAADIVVAADATDVGRVKFLFAEYVAHPDWGPGFAEYLEQQQFEKELQSLPGPYASPLGRLLLARVDGQAAGCIAFKPYAPPTICEMKRLYVREAFRGAGLGRLLVERLLSEAKKCGYSRMRLDTLPMMVPAQRLYRSLGFVDIPPYCENPIAGSAFLEKRI